MQTSRDSPAASASVQHGDAQHSEGVGAVKTVSQLHPEEVMMMTMMMTMTNPTR